MSSPEEKEKRWKTLQKKKKLKNKNKKEPKGFIDVKSELMDFNDKYFKQSIFKHIDYD